MEETRQASRRKYHYIYKTTCLVTGKFYIGMHSADCLEDNYLGSGLRLRRSINKYGKENHKKEIIEFVQTREELKKREEELVNENVLKDPMCMNLIIGGTGGLNEAARFSQIRIQRSRNKLKWLRENNSEWVKKISEKISHAKLGNKNFFKKQHSEETKKKIGEKNSISLLGERNPWFGTCWINKNLKYTRVKKEELQTWLDTGWTKGGKPAALGTCHIHNKLLKQSKMIKKETLQSWLDRGWVKGKLIKMESDVGRCQPSA